MLLCLAMVFLDNNISKPIGICDTISEDIIHVAAPEKRVLVSIAQFCSLQDCICIVLSIKTNTIFCILSLARSNSGCI